MKQKYKKISKFYKPGWYNFMPLNVDKMLQNCYICRNHNELSLIITNLNHLIKALDKTGEYYQLNSKIEKEPYECVVSQGDGSLVVGESQNSLAEAIYKALEQIL
jgi:hypothetical protein